jgi:NADH dehydrogenase FAD-containing subunit
MLGGSYEPCEIRFPVREMVENSGGTFVEGRAVRIAARERTVILEDGAELAYDVLSVNTGSTIAPTVHVDTDLGADGPKVFRVKPISEMILLRAEILDRLGDGPLRIAVIGGGPAAVETAANISRIAREANADGCSVQLIAGRSVLPGFPRTAERKVLRTLAQKGVAVRLAERVSRISSEGMVVDGSSEQVDIAVLATGVVPSRIFSDSDLPLGTDGSLAVNAHLHALGYREIFGGGDCVWFTPRSLPRAGVFAVRQGPVLVHNVAASLDHGPAARLKAFSPGGAYLLLLNLGDDTALFWRRIAGLHVVYRSESAYRLKDKIDRAFMDRFMTKGVSERDAEH